MSRLRHELWMLLVGDRLATWRWKRRVEAERRQVLRTALTRVAPPTPEAQAMIDGYRAQFEREMTMVSDQDAATIAAAFTEQAEPAPLDTGAWVDQSGELVERQDWSRGRK